MFDSLIESTPHHGLTRKTMLMPASLVLHGLALATILLASALQAVPVEPPQLLVEFFSAPPPPPPPAAPAKEARAEPVKPAATKAIPMPAGLVEPMLIPTQVSTAAQPEYEGVPGGVPGGIPGGVVGGVPGGIIGGLPDSPPPPPPPAEKAYRIGGNVKAPELLQRVVPEYPNTARLARIQGVVILEAIIHPDGSVGEIKVLRPLPLGCTEEAIRALQQFRYKPGLMNGAPVSVYLTVSFNFRLAGEAG